MNSQKQAYSTHRNERNARQINPLLLRVKNFLKFGRRWSSNPQKQLCFTWLSRVLARSARFDTTLDIACGNLNNYPFIRSKNYIGADMNRASLDYGKQAYPAARTELLMIEELEESGLKGDLVLCTQTIGVNANFDADKTMPNVTALVNSTKQNGTLVFDTGPLSTQYEKEITALLREAFAEVDVKHFGSNDKSTNIVISIFQALLMELFPKLATKENDSRRFYVAQKKHQDS